MNHKKLFLFVLGGKPIGKNVEQHDVFFSAGYNFRDCALSIKKYWDIPGVHIDTFMVVEQVDGYDVTIVENLSTAPIPEKLFFVNLGGYKLGDLEEYHKKILLAANSLEEAKKKAKQDNFFHGGLDDPNAQNHIDDKINLRGFDVDDVMVVNDQLNLKNNIILTANSTAAFKNNKITVTGYLLVDNLLNQRDG